MANPTPYTPAYSFSGWQASNPTLPLPADKVDAEFNALNVSLDETQAALQDVRRSDGKLVNKLVSIESLSGEVLALFAGNPVAKGNWAALTPYEAGNLVTQGGVSYLCSVAHTSSSDFNSDLAAGRWVLIAGTAIGVNAVNTASLADGAVTLAKLAANSVDATKIADGAVNTAELADGAVTTAKLADGAATILKGGTGATTAAAARTNLGLGTAATQNTGTSGANLPFLNGTNVWAGTNQFATTIGVGAATPAGTGAGISFPAAQSASSDANTLDDYEEGTWTPTDVSGAGLSFTTADNQYVKIGQLVICSFYVQYPVTASGAGAAIGSLPFTPQNVGGGTSLYGALISVTDQGAAFTARVENGVTRINMFNFSLGQLTNANFSNRQLRGVIVYRANA